MKEFYEESASHFIARRRKLKSMPPLNFVIHRKTKIVRDYME
jgi:hypothetical protein